MLNSQIHGLLPFRGPISLEKAGKKTVKPPQAGWLGEKPHPIAPFPKPGWFGKGFRKSGLKPTFSNKSKVAFPKTEVLGKQPLIFIITDKAFLFNEPFQGSGF
jgi:hypothetical protein